MGFFYNKYFVTFVYNMAEHLVKQGEEVIIVTSKTGNLLRYERIEGVPVYRVDCYELLGGRYPILKYNRYTREIFQILRQEKFDMVIVNARFYMHSIFAAMFAKKNHIFCI